MLSKQLRKASHLNFPFTTIQMPIQEPESHTKLAQLPKLLKSLNSLSFTTKFSFNSKIQSKVWLENSDCMRNSLLSDLLSKSNAKLEVTPSDEGSNLSEKFKNSELFIMKCEVLGFSNDEATNLLTLLKLFNLAPPTSFSHKEMVELMLKLKHQSIKYNEDYLQSLRNEAKDRETCLAQLREEVSHAKTQANRFANNLAGTVVAAVVANAAVLGFVASHGVASVAVVGGIAGVGLKYTEKIQQLKNSAFEYKFSRLIAKKQIKLERIIQLQEELDQIRDKIIELH